MSSVAALELAWAAVHTFVGCFNCALYARLRSGRAYMAFAGASLTTAVYCLGAALLVGAEDESAGGDAQRLQLAAGTVTLGAVASLLHHVTGRPRTPMLRAAWAWAGLGFAANLAGLFVDPGRAAAAASPAWIAGAELHEAGRTVAVRGYAAVALLVLAACLVDAVRRAERRRDARLIAVVMTPAVLAAAHDWIARSTVVDSVYLLTHASVLSSIGVSYLLLRRYVRAGEELTRRTLELRRSYDELHEVQEELIRKEQLAAVGELSAVIAHEVQYPLNALEGAVEGLGADELGDAERANLLGIVDEETDRLNRLVRDLLVYARPVEPHYEMLDLQRIWRSAVDAARQEHPRCENVEVDAEIELSGPVYGDPDLVERAFANLAENAFEAMPNGGVLTVRARDTDIDGTPAVELAVDDTGEGMDTLVREHARDPFFTTRPSGTGLGLAIVERVIRAHGGRVHLDENDAGGTTVRLLLPRDRRSSLPPAP